MAKRKFETEIQLLRQVQRVVRTALPTSTDWGEAYVIPKFKAKQIISSLDAVAGKLAPAAKKRAKGKEA